MGHALPKEQTLALVRDILQGVVKDVPWDSLLRLLLIRTPLRLDRLELQEQVLRTLGILAPFKIKSAWLEDVVVTQESILCLRVEAKHFYGFADMTGAEAWQEESGPILHADERARRNLGLYDVVAPGALLERVLPHPLAALLRRSPMEVEMDLGGAELVLGHASLCRSSGPSLTLAASRVSSDGPMKLSALPESDKPLCRARLRVETPRVCLTSENAGGALGREQTHSSSSCPRADVQLGGQAAIRTVCAQTTPDNTLAGMIFGPCDLFEVEVQVNSPYDDHTSAFEDPRQVYGLLAPQPAVNVAVKIADCGAGLRLSQEQVPCLFRFFVIWEQFAAFLNGLAPPRPTAAEAKEYHGRWLRRLEMAVPPGVREQDPVILAFEASHSLGQILRQRELALEMKLAMESEPRLCQAKEPKSLLGSGLSSRQGAEVPRNDFRLDLEMSGLVCEFYLCTGAAADPRAASHRLLSGGLDASQNSMGFRLQGRIDPNVVLTSAEAYLANFSLEVEALERRSTILRHEGLLRAHLDLREKKHVGQCEDRCPSQALQVQAGELHIHLDSGVASCLQDLLLPLFELFDPQFEQYAQCELGTPTASLPSRTDPTLLSLTVAADSAVFIVLTGGSGAGLLALRFKMRDCDARCMLGSDTEAQKVATSLSAESGGGVCFLPPFVSINLCGFALWAGVQTAEKSPWHSAQRSLATKDALMATQEVGLQLQNAAASLNCSPLSFCLPAADLELILPVLLKWWAALESDLEVAWCTIWGGGGALQHAADYPGPLSEGVDLNSAASAAWVRSIQISLPSIEAAFSPGDSTQCSKAAVVLRLKGQQMHMCCGDAVLSAVGGYVLKHVSISDAAGESHLLHCGDVLEDGRQAVSVRCCFSGSTVGRQRPSVVLSLNITPLWVCSYWRSVSLMLNYVVRLQRAWACEESGHSDADSDDEPFCRPPASQDQEVESSAGSGEDATPTQCWYSSADSDEQPQRLSLSHVTFKLQLTVERFLLMLPCCGSRGMQLCCESYVCATNSGMRVALSQLSLSPALVPRRRDFEAFRAPKGPLRDASFLLHPARFTISLSRRSSTDAASPCICVRLEVAPLCLSLRSTHIPFARGLRASFRRLHLECPSAPGEAHSGCPRTAAAAAASRATGSCCIGIERLQEALDGALEAESWMLQLEVGLAAVRVGIIQSPSDTELLTLLAEDARAQGTWEAKSCCCKPSSLASTVSWGTQLTTSRSRGGPETGPRSVAGRLLSLSARLGALSMDNTATDTAKPMPLLEPVHATMAHTEGLCSKTSKCAVSWLNVNVSMALVDAVVNLFRGISCPGESSDGWQEAYDSSATQGTTRSTTQCVLEDCLRGGLRQHTISAREPELRFYNHLGQGIQLTVQPDEQEHFLDHGEAWSTQVPWNAVVREERQNAEARVRFFLSEEANVKVRLSPTPTVQALPVHPAAVEVCPKSRPALQLSRSWSGSKSEMSNHLGGDTSWLLVRRRVSGTLNQLEIHLSSLLFLENRTTLSVSVAPLDSGPWMVLPAGSAPQPVPLAWCLSQEAGHSPPMLWCGLTSEVQCDCANVRAHSCRPGLRRRGLLQALFSRGSWRSLCRYRSMVAEDYFLRARELTLRSQSGSVTANLSATVYGVSADLHAPLQALFFSVALEPLVQFCNRLCHELQLHPGQAPLSPGRDAELRCLSEALSLRISAPGQAWRMQQQIWPDRMRKDGHQRRLPFFEELESERAVASCSPSPSLFVTLATEPGLALPEWWAPLSIHQYSPRARRLIIFTHYWLVNRRSDCCIYVPRRQRATTCTWGEGKEQQQLQDACRQIECNQRRMLSDDHSIHRGRLQLGVCNSERSQDSVPEVFALTEPFRVDHPTQGAVMARRSKQDPAQRCLGFSVRPAPLPFYRTLIVQVVRRFTLLNHTQHTLWVRESDRGGPVRLPKGECVPFDPQGVHMKLAISGIDPSVEKNGAVFEHYSAFFPLCVDEVRSCIQLMHKVDLDLYAPSSTCLALAEPLHGQSSAWTGWAWCLTNVDIRLEGSSVLVRLSEPLRPDFRLVNRTSSSVEVAQDCAGAPSFILQPEHQMSFCWFRPGGPQRLRICLGGQRHCYDIGAVQKHWPPLQLHYPPRSGETLGWQEEFHVRTCVHRGSREVHIHPWCRLTNQKRDAVVVREASGNAQGRLVHSGESVCLQPEPSGVLSLQVRCSLQQGQGGWSQPVRLAKVLSGSRGFLRHLKRGGSGMTSTFEITAVEIKQDPVSDFLLVELKPHVESHCPYLLENLSSLEVMITQAGEATDRAEASLLPGERLPFLPLGLDSQSSGGCLVWVQALRGNESPSGGTMVDIGKPQEQPAGHLHLSVLKERPRRMLIRNGETVSEISRRTSLRPSGSPGPNSGLGPGSFPALLLARRFLTAAAPQKKWKTETGSALVQVQSTSKALPTSGTSTYGAVPASPSTPSAPRAQRGEVELPQGSKGGARDGGQRELRLPRTLRPQFLWRGAARGTKAAARRRSRLSTFDGESPRLSPSMAKRLRRGSMDVFWQRSHQLTPKHSHRRGRSQAEFHLEGCGLSLIDGAALQEVAYLSADRLDASLVWSSLPRRLLDVTLRSLQLDVIDSTGWRSSNMLRPRRGPLPHRQQPDEVPFISLHARWLALDHGAGNAAHLEIECLSWKMLSVEARLDTMNCFRLAQWALELEAHAAPLLGQGQGQVLRAPDTLCEQYSGDWASDSLTGAARRDFASPTPVFIRRLFAHRVQLVLSVRFSGKRDSDCKGSEELQALHHVLRKLLPFDVSQASIALGAGMPSWSAQTSSRDREAWLRDEFLPRGLTWDRVAQELQSCTSSILRQVPKLLGAGRLIGSPSHLCFELAKAAQLFLLGLRVCDRKAILAAVFLGLAAFFESAEGILVILAKTACRLSAGTVPTGLWKEPSGVPGALMDLLWYGFPWHARQSYREWKRQMHIACSSQSSRLALCGLIKGLLHTLALMGSALLLMAAKLLQVAHLASAELARCACPEHVAELGAPSALRVGPTLFRLGMPLQFASEARAVLEAVSSCASGTRHCDWRLLPLPAAEGTLVAVPGCGFFLVRSSSGSCCLSSPAREGRSRLHVAWQALGSWQSTELMTASNLTATPWGAWVLRFRPLDCNRPCAELRLRSSEAAFAAFGFVQDCLVDSWTSVDVPSTRSTPPISGSRVLLRRVRRSAQTRASV